MSDGIRLPDLREAAETALIFAIMGDRGKCVDPLCAIVEMDPPAVHAALCGWSGLTLSVFEPDHRAGKDGEFWCIEAEEIETGRPGDIDSLKPATRDALRLVSCFGNRDYATTTAIVKVAFRDPEYLAELLFESVTLAAEAAKFLKAQRDAAEERS